MSPLLLSSTSLVQFSIGSQPETSMVQPAVQINEPVPRPRLAQVWLPKSVPSQLSPGSILPLPQRPEPPVPPVLDALLAVVPPPMPPMPLELDELDAVLVVPPVPVDDAVEVPRGPVPSPVAQAANPAMSPTTVAVNLQDLAIVVSKKDHRRWRP